MFQTVIDKLIGRNKSGPKKKAEPLREPTILEKARIERARMYHNSRNPGSHDTTVLDNHMQHHTDFSSSSSSYSDDCSSSSSCCDSSSSSSFSCD